VRECKQRVHPSVLLLSSIVRICAGGGNGDGGGGGGGGGGGSIERDI
jgi:hypothetical protein